MAQGRRVKIDGKVRTIPAERVHRYAAMQERLDTLYPGDDEEHVRASALQAVAVYLLDAPEPAAVEVGRSPAEAQRAAREAIEARNASIVERLQPAGDARRATKRAADAAYASASAVAALAAEDGLTERDAGRIAGIDKLTVRKFRGKRDRA